MTRMDPYLSCCAEPLHDCHLDNQQLHVAGKKSLSLLRLLVPDTDDSASIHLLSMREDPEQFVSMAGIDLAGVPVNPFSASLLPGKLDGPSRQHFNLNVVSSPFRTASLATCAFVFCNLAT